MNCTETGAGSGTTVTREDKVKQVLDEIIEKLPEEFNMVEIMNKVEERTPYGFLSCGFLFSWNFRYFFLFLSFFFDLCFTFIKPNHAKIYFDENKKKNQ